MRNVVDNRCGTWFNYSMTYRTHPRIRYGIIIRHDLGVATCATCGHGFTIGQHTARMTDGTQVHMGHCLAVKTGNA